ncbi:MAG: helix-turn-helix domain-containing protein [Solobacterium sp.]|nr:helix-turn-helix domain-containing protein [Solobacterium sp.]
MPKISSSLAQQIVESVKDACGYDINYITDQGIILASTDPSRINTFHEIGYQCASTREIIEVTENNRFDGTQKGVNIPCIYHDELIGIIGISGEPDDVRQYGHLAIRIMRLLLKEKELEQSHETKRAEASQVIRTLLEGEPNTGYVRAFLKRKNLSYNDAYRVILMTPETHSLQDIGTMESRIESMLSELNGVFWLFEYPSTYLLVIEEHYYEKQKELLKELLLLPSVLAVGSSRRLAELKRSYEDAKLVLRGQFDSFQEIDELTIELLFADTSAHGRTRYLETTVASLSEKEFHVLEVYFESGQSLKESAEQLYIHKNTLQYQLDRIHKKCGLDPRKFQDAVTLYLALRIRRMDNAG